MGILHSRYKYKFPLDCEYTNIHDSNTDIQDNEPTINMKDFEEFMVFNTGLRPNWLQWKKFLELASKHQEVFNIDELKISKLDYMISFDDK